MQHVAVTITEDFFLALMYHALGGVSISDQLSGRNPLMIKVILAAGGVQPQ